MTWGLVLGNIRTNSVWRINGEWTELTEIAIGPETAKKALGADCAPTEVDTANDYKNDEHANLGS